MDAALRRYRLAAWVVGSGLVVLVCVGVPLKYLAGEPTISQVVGFAHGWLYMGYLALAFDLGRRARWSAWRILGLMAAGTIPFLSFVVERRVTASLRGLVEAAPQARNGSALSTTQ
jgi:integral membrane protein